MIFISTINLGRGGGVQRVRSTRHKLRFLTCFRPDGQTLTWSKSLTEKGEKASDWLNREFGL